MLKKTTLILLLVTGAIKLHAQEKWFVRQISEKVSVSFPKQPKKINEISYGIKDSTGTIFTTSIVNLLSIVKLDLTALNAEIEKQQFADDFVSGISTSFPKYKFEQAKIITVKGQRAYGVMAKDEENKQNLYMRICFLDGISYGLTCILPDGTNYNDKDLFLNSISFKKN